jgi:adenosylcobinamide-phosphate synthase
MPPEPLSIITNLSAFFRLATLPGPSLIILAAALLLDALYGYPAPVFRAIGHPVTWIGSAIAWLDRTLNRRHRRAAGVLALALLLTLTGGTAWIVQSVLLRALPHPIGIAVLAVLAATLLAQRSLFQHVRAVEQAIHTSLPAGRAAIAHIVGRNPATLDAPGIARAAIESLAENFADGVVAPAFWCAIAGLPGIALYKAINTADSMIGHRTPRHEQFGWAAARLDDVVNLPASRLAALLLLTAATLHRTNPAAAWRAIRRDARHHRSPNAGWPESAMAGALGLRLAGPRTYGTTRIDDAWMGDGTPNATPTDIARALRLYRTACAAGLALTLAAWLI